MTPRLGTLAVVLLIAAVTARAQNCCAPAVPQQGVMGETVALPHVLEIGLHYEYLRAEGFYMGDHPYPYYYNPDTRTVWNRATLTLGYGIMPRLSVSAIVPYVHKRKQFRFTPLDEFYNYTADGVGDIILFGRYSLLQRSFVNYRELSLGLGVKMPTGSTDRRHEGFLLAEELQPGTGSWDFLSSLSFYQGLEPVDFYLSASIVLNTRHEGYRFGDQFAYLGSMNFHAHPRFDLSIALTGIIRGRDCQFIKYATGQNKVPIESTGRQQIWLVPGLQVQVIPQTFRLQVFYEDPIYQRFNGIQLGSDYNLRFTTIWYLPLGETEE